MFVHSFFKDSLFIITLSMTQLCLHSHVLYTVGSRVYRRCPLIPKHLFRSVGLLGVQGARYPQGVILLRHTDNAQLGGRNPLVVE